MRSRKAILAVLVVLAAWAVPVLATGEDIDPGSSGQVMIGTVPMPDSPASQVMIGTWPQPERVIITWWFVFAL